MEFLKEVIFAIAGGSGFAALDWKTVVMLVIACVLLYMGIGKALSPAAGPHRIRYAAGQPAHYRLVCRARL